MPNRILGVDFGTKKVGLALADESSSVAFPQKILLNTKKLIREIHVFAQGKNVKTIVVGESMNNDGAMNVIAKDAKTLGDELKERFGYTIVYEPEFFTSAEAHQRLFVAGQVKRGEDIDAHAAALILQRYLDRKKHGA